MKNTALKRILAWIALLFLLLLIVNILFIHIYVTESAIAFSLYVLVFFFGRKRDYHANDQDGGEGETDNTDNKQSNDIDGNEKYVEEENRKVGQDK